MWGLALPAGDRTEHSIVQAVHSNVRVRPQPVDGAIRENIQGSRDVDSDRGLGQWNYVSVSLSQSMNHSMNTNNDIWQFIYWFLLKSRTCCFQRRKPWCELFIKKLNISLAIFYIHTPLTFTPHTPHHAPEGLSNRCNQLLRELKTCPVTLCCARLAYAKWSGGQEAQ